MRTPENKVGYLVQRAYFQAKGQFLKPEQFRPRDVRAAEKSLGLRSSCDITRYANNTAANHRKRILSQHGWNPCTSAEKARLDQLGRAQAKAQMDAEDSLFGLLEYCWRNKIVIPRYATLEAVVVDAREEYLAATLCQLDRHITPTQRTALLSLMNNPEATTRFRALKRINPGIDETTLRQNASLLADFRDTFLVVEPLLSQLDLSNQAIKEFANWIYNSNLSQIKRFRNEPLLLLRLLAFVRDQFYLRQDAAVNALLKRIRTTINKAKGHDRKQREALQEEFDTANRVVTHSAKNADGVIRLIGQIARNQSESLSERNEKVINLVDNYLEAVDPDFDAYVAKMDHQLNTFAANSSYYDYLFEAGSALVRCLSPLVRALTFDEESPNGSLVAAINAFRSESFMIDDSTPTAFIRNSDLRAYNREDGYRQITKYKIILFSLIDRSIRDRSLTLKHSYQYVSDQYFLIPTSEWRLHKDEILFANQLSHFSDGGQVLKGVGDRLRLSYRAMNENLPNNPFVKIDRQGNWRPVKDEADYSASGYIPKLIGEGKPQTLYEIVREIDGYTGFSDDLKHFQESHAKATINKKLLYATIMSLGTNLGHTDMAKASKITSKQLRDTERLWLSEKNLRKANQCLVNFIQELPLPTIYNDAQGKLHTSSDGRKVVVAVDSLLANYSYKYYGKEQGVSVNSFVSNVQAFFHVNVLSSSDREAAYMMDGLVQSKQKLFQENADELADDFFGKHKHSTDMHGYTDAMFTGLHLLDVAYAPRLIDLPSRALFSLDKQSLVKHSGYTIGPKTQVSKKLILDNWDDILRFMATIKSGRQSASLIFRRLAASKRASNLYEAIKAFGKLLKSHFIAMYISDESLRRTIQKQLNRVELGQKFSGALFFGGKGKLKVGSEEEIQVVMLCNTILKNVVILWNYLYLSDYLIGLNKQEDVTDVLGSISQGSVIAWRHINMHGVYDFDHKPVRSFKASIKQMKSIRI